MKKVMSIQKAIELINDGDEILFNAFGSMGFPEATVIELGKKFREKGHPNNLKYISGAGQGVWNETDMIEHISLEGMVSRVTSSHFVPMRGISKLTREEKIEAYNMPLGIFSHIVRASAGRKPGILSRVGLKTFIDPRNGGGCMNARSDKNYLSEVMEIGGEEYLFYKAIKPNVAILRGTTADVNGNITMEKEAVLGDPYECAMCVKANGGKVIVQVERLSGIAAERRLVKIPNVLIDAIIVVPDQKQSFLEQYNPAVSGEWIVPEAQVEEELNKVIQINSEIVKGKGKTRGLDSMIIAKRAAMELEDGDVINLGIGVAEGVGKIAKDFVTDLTLTIESGIINGAAVGGVCFGAGINAEVLQEQGNQFDFYDGGGLDATFVGAMQVDAVGNVNVSKSGSNLIGVGGFINLTTSAKKVVYCFPFTGGGAVTNIKDNKLVIEQEGKFMKFVKKVEQISFSGEVAAKGDQTILYVTERAVFELTEDGIMLIEIAPGVDLTKDILDHMEFNPIISESLKEMDSNIFDF